MSITLQINQISKSFTPLKSSQFSMNTVGLYGPSGGERVKSLSFLLEFHVRIEHIRDRFRWSVNSLAINFGNVDMNFLQLTIGKTL